MRILLTGSSGQVGWELQRSLAVLGELNCPARAELDLSKPATIAPYLARTRPELVVNPAAYTAVDNAEQEPALAFAVNGESPAELAAWCAANNAALIHYSTDYVYPGDAASPYSETDATGPTGVYGASKLAGDQAIAASGAAYLIFRTSWVYAARGKNFLNTMLRLAETMPELKVVDDQTGAPTPARLIAEVTLAALARGGFTSDALKPLSGIYHLVPSGYVSWHGFAQEIFRQRGALTADAAVPVAAITTAQFPTPAARPANSRMRCDKLQSQFGLTMPDWQSALNLVLRERLAAD